ncbi:CMP-N-acetylneuraminate-beta-galactosamide-alpha-2,3-sialyltransferase 1-like [Sinocyclocheilus anshuiensis]|uniref:CMP-N-acetylneuraminate-beta-galactosamide- alpha-2,3-sialyltransferase 1-like n=1 Tax=Sinocyclocheilus anshuiensis TaxID=1608454 RepID=UPI0007BAAB73|nr:PREDICTED: CMP-N-acetylneuraminate-beta-galactosamide-alpha-2,3-sialyltransferase 1-like [Sinocyclocheilus anshuiensis]
MMINKRTLRQVVVFVSVASTICIVLFCQTSTWSFHTDACVCNCAMDSEGLLWFSQRYKPSANVTLNTKNSPLDFHTYWWWKSLQNESTVADYKKVVEVLFSLFPDKDHYSDTSPSRCRTCAVVGNSGNLIGSHYGALIDSQDFVIRMNEGPTKGFEQDVGSKTTHRVIYPESAVDMDETTHLILLPFKILDLQWLISIFTTRHIDLTYMYVKPSVKADRNKVMILHPAFMKYIYESWLQSHGGYPSTGFISLIFALHICDEVSMFGFGPTKDGVWHHYFDDFFLMHHSVKDIRIQQYDKPQQRKQSSSSTHLHRF